LAIKVALVQPALNPAKMDYGLNAQSY